MPEPNLPPLHVGIGPVSGGCVHVDDLKNRIPEMPENVRQRLIKENELTLEQSIRVVVRLKYEFIADKINYSIYVSE